MTVSPDHPRQRLLFALEPGFDEAAVGRVAKLVDEIAATRSWTLGPPQFVNETAEDDEAEPGDEPIRTVGAIVEVYCTFDEWAARLPAAINRAQFEEVSALVRAFSALSAELGVEVALELDEDQIGWIERGKPDDSVADGFLGEWERSLR